MNQAGNLVIAHAYHGAIWLYDPRGGVDNKTLYIVTTLLRRRAARSRA
jgi:hypothetical protein